MPPPQGPDGSGLPEREAHRRIDVALARLGACLGSRDVGGVAEAVRAVRDAVRAYRLLADRAPSASASLDRLELLLDYAQTLAEQDPPAGRVQDEVE